MSRHHPRPKLCDSADLRDKYQRDTVHVNGLRQQVHNCVLQRTHACWWRVNNSMLDRCRPWRTSSNWSPSCRANPVRSFVCATRYLINLNTLWAKQRHVEVVSPVVHTRRVTYEHSVHSRIGEETWILQ